MKFLKLCAIITFIFLKKTCIRIRGARVHGRTARRTAARTYVPAGRAGARMRRRYDAPRGRRG
eukprot:SAG31_NODE_18079_length_647_cov_1.625912_1_plen_62_part_10